VISTRIVGSVTRPSRWTRLLRSRPITAVDHACHVEIEVRRRRRKGGHRVYCCGCVHIDVLAGRGGERGTVSFSPTYSGSSRMTYFAPFSMSIANERRERCTVTDRPLIILTSRSTRSPPPASTLTDEESLEVGAIPAAFAIWSASLKASAASSERPSNTARAQSTGLGGGWDARREFAHRLSCCGRVHVAVLG
jgi:hypothetical protein